MHGVRRGAVAVAVAALVAGLGAVTTVPAMSVAPVGSVAPVVSAKPKGCPDIQMVWAGGMGSGLIKEASKRAHYLDLGAVAVRTIAGHAPQLGDDDLAAIREQGLDHPHFAGWRRHARETVRAVERSVRRCPDAAVVVGGHSEGAVAAHQALRTLGRTQYAAERRHVAGVWLLGDPLDERDRPGWKGPGALIGRGPALPAWVGAKGLLHTSCNYQDWLCDDRQTEIDPPRVSQHYDYDAYKVSYWLVDLPADEEIEEPTISGGRVRIPVYADVAHGLPGGVRLTVARPLPKGMRLKRGLLVGKTPRQRAEVHLWVRGRTIAPAVRRRLTVVLAAGEQAAAKGTALVSRAFGGGPANAGSYGAEVSGDGRTVVYTSAATNLVRRTLPEDSTHVFAWDARSERTELVSVDDRGQPVASNMTGVSADGRAVMFADGSGVLWYRDRDARTSRRVPGAGSDATLSNDGLVVTYPDDGRALRWHADTGDVEDLGVGGQLQAASANGRFLAVVRDRQLHIWDTVAGADTAVIPFQTPGSCAQGVSDISDNGDYVVRGLSCGGYGGGSSFLHDLPGFRTVVSSGGALAVNADASWSLREVGMQSLVLRPTDGGGRRFVVNDPTVIDDEYPYSGVSVAGDGRAAAYATAALDILPNVWTSEPQVYYWKAP